MVNRVRVSCPTCRHELNVRVEYLGQDVVCRYCENSFPLADWVIIPCPGCGEEGMVRAESLGRWVRCKEYGHPFLAESANAHAPIDPSTPPAGLAWYLPVDTGALLEKSDALEQELHQLRASFETTTSDQASTLRQLGDALGEVARLRGHSEELQRQLDEAEDKSHEDDGSRLELEALRSERDHLKAELEAAQLAASLAEREPHDERLGEASALEIEALRAECERLRAESEMTRILPSPPPGVLDDLRAECDQLRASLLDAEERAEALQADLDATLAAHGQLHEEAAGVSAREIEALRAECDRLRAESEMTRILPSPPPGELDDLRAECDRLRAEVAEAAPLRAQLQDAEGRVEALHAQLEAARSAHGQIREEAAAALGPQIDDLRAECDRLRAEARDQSEEFERLRAQILAAKDRAEGCQAERDVALADLQRSRAEAAEARHEIERIQSERDRLRADLSAAESWASELRIARDAALADRDRYVAELGEATGILAMHGGRDTERDALAAQLDMARDEAQQAVAEARAQAEEERHLLEDRLARAGEIAAKERGTLSASLDAALADRDRVEAALRAEREERDRERSRAAESVKALQERWDVERETLAAQVERVRDSVRLDFEPILAEADARIEAERRIARDRIEALAEEFEHEREALRAEANRFREELDTRIAAGPPQPPDPGPNREELERRLAQAHSELRAAGAQLVAAESDRHRIEELEEQLTEVRVELERYRGVLLGLGLRPD